MSSARARQAAGRDKSAGCDVAQKASLDKGVVIRGTPAAVSKNRIIFPKKNHVSPETPKPRDDDENAVS